MQSSLIRKLQLASLRIPGITLQGEQGEFTRSRLRQFCLVEHGCEQGKPCSHSLLLPSLQRLFWAI